MDWKDNWRIIILIDVWVSERQWVQWWDGKACLCSGMFTFIFFHECFHSSLFSGYKATLTGNHENSLYLEIVSNLLFPGEQRRLKAAMWNLKIISQIFEERLRQVAKIASVCLLFWPAYIQVAQAHEKFPAGQ